jgi:hypothetical protein
MQFLAPIFRRKPTTRSKSFRADGIIGSYYISTNDALYCLKNGLGQQVSAQGGYGIAIDGDQIIRSVDVKNASRIVSLSTHDRMNLDHVEEVIYEMPFRSSNGRIHQLSCDREGHFYAALAERNSILRFNKSENGWKFKEFTPFSDRFGAPILFDHNHINSVLPHDDFLLFVAYKAGPGSMIGVIRDDRVLGFRYPNQGMHDIFITKTGFLCFDTFGDGDDPGGRPITENGPISSAVFEQPPGYILRGAAQFGCEIVYGHSHKGERSKRFCGNGGILHFRHGCFSYYPVPSAQVYQIVRSDGVFFDHSGRGFDVVISQLTRVFGQPVYSGVVSVL